MSNPTENSSSPTSGAAESYPARDETVEMNPLLDRDPKKHGGDLCISGTRLPIKHIWDYLQNGYTVEEYCDLFKVSEEKVEPIAKFLRAG